MQHVVVVGAGLAGARTVEALRERGFDGRLTLVGAEPHLPYERPPLSKAVLLGEVEDTTLRPSYSDLGVTLRLGVTATGLQPGVLTTTAGEIDFDGLVLACGSTPSRLTGTTGEQLLRTVDDARGLRARLRPGARVVVVGAGWIGAEVATAAARAGCAVTVLEAAAAPLAHAVGSEVGRATIGWYAEAGVQLRTHTAVEAVRHDAVLLASGERVPADVVVVGIGSRPALGWLAGSGVQVGRGVHVDEQLRSAVPGVFAVGDCATWWSGRYGARLHVEHWDDALHGPDVVAQNLLGGAAVHNPVPYFWSDQFGRTVQYAGYHPVADRFLWRGDPGDGTWTGCWLREGVLVAVVTAGRPRDLVQGRKLIAAGSRPDLRLLLDPDVPMRETV